jgi:hypothetical protein
MVSTGGGYGAQSVTPLHFGLTSIDKVSVAVTWLTAQGAVDQLCPACRSSGVGAVRSPEALSSKMPLAVNWREENSVKIPQGSPILPLLANFYMHRFVLGWDVPHEGL